MCTVQYKHNDTCEGWKMPFYFIVSPDSFNINSIYKAGSTIQCSHLQSDTSHENKYTGLHRISMSSTVFQSYPFTI